MSDRRDVIEFAHGINLSAYLDEELPAKRRDELVRSLAHDSTVWGDLEALNDTISVLNRMPRRCVPKSDAVPPDLRPTHDGQGWQENRVNDFRLSPLEVVANMVLIGLVVLLYLTFLPSSDYEVEPLGGAVAEMQE